MNNMERVAHEIVWLWRAVDLLMHEIGKRSDTSDWIRDEWAELVHKRAEVLASEPEDTVEAPEFDTYS